MLSLTGTHPQTYASFTLFEEGGLEGADKCYLRTRAVGTAQKVTLNAASQAGQFNCLVPGFGLILSFLSQLGHSISTLYGFSVILKNPEQAEQATSSGLSELPASTTVLQ